jgi:hypothetical protein
LERRPYPNANAHSDTICSELKQVDGNFSGVVWSLPVCDCEMVFRLNGDRGMFFSVDARHGVSTTSGGTAMKTINLTLIRASVLALVAAPAGTPDPKNLFEQRERWSGSTE